MKNSHYVYILLCSDQTLYTGYTTDIEKRIKEHNGLGNTKTQQKAGARYTRGRRPVELFYTEVFDTKVAAMKREYEIKQFTRARKELLVQKRLKKV